LPIHTLSRKVTKEKGAVVERLEAIVEKAGGAAVRKSVE
jgi:hypothetical protein